MFLLVVSSMNLIYWVSVGLNRVKRAELNLYWFYVFYDFIPSSNPVNKTTGPQSPSVRNYKNPLEFHFLFLSWGAGRETPSLCAHQWQAAVGGDCCMKSCHHIPFQLHFQEGQQQQPPPRKDRLQSPWPDLSPTRKSASRSASGASWEWRMWPSWRRASIVTCTSPWWKTETLQHPGIITLPWLTLWEITWWGDGSEHSSFTMKQTQR